MIDHNEVADRCFDNGYAAGKREAADEIDRLIACAEAAERERDALRALLKRYRTETPLGHQPHMIAHQVDAVLGDEQKGPPNGTD